MDEGGKDVVGEELVGLLVHAARVVVGAGDDYGKMK